MSQSRNEPLSHIPNAAHQFSFAATERQAVSRDAQVTIALGGGGDATRSRAIDRIFASWLPPRGRLLYIPNALGTDTATVGAATRWIRETFEPIADLRIETRTELGEIGGGGLAFFDGIYIGGGNTYSLLHQFRTSGFLPIVRDAVHKGLPAYGGSAGAALLGADIATVRDIDDDPIGLHDTTAIDVFAGIAVWVHYRKENDSLIAEYVKEKQQPVFAIPEDAGVAYFDGSARAVGESPVVVFDMARGSHPMERLPAEP